MILLCILYKAHTGIEFDAMVGDIIVRQFDLEDDLTGVLGEEVEEDGFAETLVAEGFVDSEMFDVDKIGERPIGEDADRLVVVAACSHKEMKIRVAFFEFVKRGTFLQREGRLEKVF